jgi:hypothetical protein
LTNGIRRNPAGMETTERISGTQRPSSTAALARRSNHASARTRSWGLRPNQRP